MPGGWSEGPMDQSAKEAMDFALEQLHTTGKLEWIISVKQQVVSGMNYEIAFELDNKTRWNALVYRNLAGEFTLTKLSKRP
ncbi:MAG: cystatin domain-containing protein [Synechococcaceae cyanobacterium]